jgi:hypothetical protein
MTQRTVMTLALAAGLLLPIAFGGCSPDGTYQGGGRGGTSGTIDQVDSGPDSPADSGTKDTGTPDTPTPPLDTGTG